MPIGVRSVCGLAVVSGVSFGGGRSWPVGEFVVRADDDSARVGWVRDARVRRSVAIRTRSGDECKRIRDGL